MNKIADEYRYVTQDHLEEIKKAEGVTCITEDGYAYIKCDMCGTWTPDRGVKYGFYDHSCEFREILCPECFADLPNRIKDELVELHLFDLNITLNNDIIIITFDDGSLHSIQFNIKNGGCTISRENKNCLNVVDILHHLFHV